MPLSDKLFFQRCFELAKLGGKAVRPNPKVGCVIVHQNKIIGEGYHMSYGGAHAEVNAINSIHKDDLNLLPVSTAYVSLEPCHHYGHTPPCVDLLIKHNIGSVRIALADPTEKVNHQSINKMKVQGIDVQLDNDNIVAKDLISEFYAVYILKRPFVQIKVAKSKHNFIGNQEEQFQLTNKFTNVFTHKLRGHTDAILVGTNTARIDDPSLTLRNYPGEQPQRIVLDRAGTLPITHQLLSDDLSTIIVSENTELNFTEPKSIIILDFSDKDFINNLLNELFKKNIHHLMVEGGSNLIKSFIKSNSWDEAVVIDTSNDLNEGIKAPNINGTLFSGLELGSDKIHFIKNEN